MQTCKINCKHFINACTNQLGTFANMQSLLYSSETWGKRYINNTETYGKLYINYNVTMNTRSDVGICEGVKAWIRYVAHVMYIMVGEARNLIDVPIGLTYHIACSCTVCMSAASHAIGVVAIYPCHSSSSSSRDKSM